MNSLHRKTPTADPSLPHENGSPHPSSDLVTNGAAGPRVLPSHTARKGGRVLWVAIALTLLAGGAAYAGFFFFYKPSSTRADVLLHTVKKEDLPVTVTEKGTLESAENRDVVCKVRAGNKGYSASINWVVDDGTLVKKGQLLMVLDDSDFQDRYRAEKILVDQAYAAKLVAEEQYQIVLKQNEIDIALAETKVEIAELDLNKYTGHKVDDSLAPLAAVAGAPAMLAESGEFKQLLDDVTGRLRLNESDVEQNRERAAWAERMVKMRYMSAAQAQAEKSRMESSLETMRKTQTERNILQTFTRSRTLTQLRSDLDNARKALDQAHKKAQATEIQADIDRKTKHSVYLQEFDKLRDIEDQIRECKIHSPQDGMVVYYKSDSSSRFSGSSNQGLIEQGAQVKEGQKMLRIPDLRRMQVNTKVHEAMVSRIRGDVRRSTGFFDAVRAALMVNPNAITRLTSLQDDYLETLKSNYRDRENYVASRGQQARIRVDAIPDRSLPGHVRSVAAVASQQDFFASDVKLYPTLVLIDEAVEGLKPDMTAEVTIQVEAAREHVLAIPLQAVIGGAEMGATRKVFVRTPSGYEERELKLGLANERMVEVVEGLTEGDEVVLNPKILAGEKSKVLEADAPRSSRGGNDKGGDAKGGDPSKAGKKKKGPPAGPAPAAPTS